MAESFRKYIALFLLPLLESCTPHAFFSPTGPQIHPVAKDEPLVLFCEIPLPPYNELGILMIPCKNEKCRNLYKYAHRLGANGIIYDEPSHDGSHRLMLIDRNWPLMDQDVSLGHGKLLKNDILTCKTETKTKSHR